MLSSIAKQQRVNSEVTGLAKETGVDSESSNTQFDDSN